ncbi:contractile injection system tape measure protein, partial [Allosphingosinicella sp.]|uniref:contractile injection system tape measure protein n=1 Tax=Allosphingosinicella sp. TaxID=2823234 RepID=UPI002F10D730
MRKPSVGIETRAVRLRHVIEDQSLEVEAPSQAAAFALLERLGGLNQQRLLPAIDRVFDEFDRTAEVIRIERIELDLGRFGPGELDQVEARLTEALRAALRRTLARGPTGSRKLGRPQAAEAELAALLSVEGTLVEALEHYLLHGTWPYCSALDAATAPAEVLASLIDTSGHLLATMLRRHSGSE